MHRRGSAGTNRSSDILNTSKRKNRKIVPAIPLITESWSVFLRKSPAVCLTCAFLRSSLR